LAKFLEDVGHSGMAGLHPSLNNTDRIGSWIQKERLLQNPLGQSYEGIVLNQIYYLDTSANNSSGRVRVLTAPPECL
jgi:hypothetical protein